MEDETIRRAILDAVHRRGAGKSVCPSEIARAMTQDWRPLMSEVRRVAGQLAKTGEISVTQKGKRVDAESARGPIRLTVSS